MTKLVAVFLFGSQKDIETLVKCHLVCFVLSAAVFVAVCVSAWHRDLC